MKHQLALMGTTAQSRIDSILREINNGFLSLGLDPGIDFESLSTADADKIDWDGVPIGIWFGDAATASVNDVGLLGKFLNESAPLFPVVDSLAECKNLPSTLKHVNAHAWDSIEDPARLTGDIMKAFRLTRSQRQAFISYKRSDAQGVASQLFHEFARRGYRVFLDVASVESGVDFQEALWARMADVDLLVFLDTPEAITSRWVYQELARAHDLGLGVLQLVWPHPHQRTPGTELSEFQVLLDNDFVGGKPLADAVLTEDKVRDVVAMAERSRLRSIHLRRLRVINDLVDQAGVRGLHAVVEPRGRVELYKQDVKVADVFTLVGIPDAVIVQEREVELADPPWERTRIVYSGLGIDPSLAEHLEWLNRHHLLQTSQIDSLSSWLGGL